ncbi:hypothetical protein OVS_00805 [Mycoplasma ovis str. Michigan]|uniref:Uncharacterized protein n=1 Tax=Mycoplasma ovis str. Michigan TaxID=1415773 RepID=A0ABM5P0A1_9MOLU|nr:hypothetical protein [Mycoplasma ovis]AHC39827.1 hypothetical protein OVS_00805 [Mycoplasma ovis str. Michigan]
MAFRIPKLFSFGLPLFALGSPIAITIPKQTLSEAPAIHHYFFRIPLLNGSTNNDKLLQEDKDRLEGYYKRYYNYQTNINSIDNFGTKKVEGSNQPNLFIQVQRSDYLDGREWEWLKTVKLNQLTIDRWFEKKVDDTDLLDESKYYQELIKVENILTPYTKLARNALNQDAIDIYFKGTTISTSEIKRLVYFPSDRIGQKNWYVWWDKELLRLKLNFGFHIWFFNQSALSKYKFVKNYFHNKKRKELKKQLSTLYKSLSQIEKDFFELYFQEIWLSKKDNHDYDSATLNPMEFESKDLNIMYNLLSSQSKDLGIFKGHLIQVLKGGDKERFESFFPNHINYAAGPDALHELKGESDYKPDVKLTITPDKTLDKEWNVSLLVDWIKHYSVRHFTLRTKDSSKNQWPAIVFDPTKGSGVFPVIRESYLSQSISTA